MGKKSSRFKHGHSVKSHHHHTIWVRWNNKRKLSLEDNAEAGMSEPWRQLEGGYEKFFEYVSGLPRFFENGEHKLEIDRLRDDLGKMHGYAPGWIRWADDTQQSNNRNSVKKLPDGTPLHIAAAKNGINSRTAVARARAGHTIEIAATAKPGVKLRSKTEAKDELLQYWVSTGFVRAEDDGRLIDLKKFQPILCTQDKDGYFTGWIPSWVKRAYSETYNKPLSPKKTPFRVHRLLGFIWFGPPGDVIQSIEHRNGNPGDNSRNNLLGWVTPKDQSLYARLRAPHAEVTPLLPYNEYASYLDLLIPRPKIERQMTEPTSANFAFADVLFADFKEQIRESCFGEDLLLALLVLAAPSNEVRVESDGTLTILVQDLNSKEITRVRFAHEGFGARQISPRHKVFLACSGCGHETADGRPEIADRLPGKRLHKSQCKVCASLGMVFPALAKLLMQDPITGEPPIHPFKLPVRTKGVRAWLKCRVPGCQLPGGQGGSISVKQFVQRGMLPICEYHRGRSDNFRST